MANLLPDMPVKFFFNGQYLMKLGSSATCWLTFIGPPRIVVYMKFKHTDDIKDRALKIPLCLISSLFESKVLFCECRLVFCCM